MTDKLRFPCRLSRGYSIKWVHTMVFKAALGPHGKSGPQGPLSQTITKTYDYKNFNKVIRLDVFISKNVISLDRGRVISSIDLNE